jgi:hypothetical protein
VAFLIFFATGIVECVDGGVALCANNRRFLEIRIDPERTTRAPLAIAAMTNNVHVGLARDGY